MSLRTWITGFLDNTVEARFKRDTEGRLVFFPMGFGAGRIVPDAATEARLRRASRVVMVAVLAVIVPVVAALNAIHPLTGLGFVAFIIACSAAGFAMQLYPMWLSRGLARSNVRMSYAGAMMHSLDRFGTGFLVFGLITSVLFTLTSAVLLAYPAARGVSDATVLAICTAIFAPMSFLYARALRRRRRGAAAS